MITAVDTSVLFDVLLVGSKFGPGSEEALRQADAEGSLVVCEIVYAELAANFSSKSTLDRALAHLDIRFDSLDEETAFVGGRAYRSYRDHGGPRTRILADFLIGAHAQSRAARLLSRDDGFYRQHFRKLKVLTPAQP